MTVLAVAISIQSVSKTHAQQPYNVLCVRFSM